MHDHTCASQMERTDEEFSTLKTDLQLGGHGGTSQFFR